jgi:hypothetical protein
MAFPLAEETLRTMQNTFQIYETLFSEYATIFTDWGVLPSLCSPYGAEYCYMVEAMFGNYGLARVSPIHDPAGLASVVLVQ